MCIGAGSTGSLSGKRKKRDANMGVGIMKVLLLNQIPEVNNKYTFSLARALLRQGVQVEVCGIEDDDVSAYTDVPYLNLFYSYSKIPSLPGKVFSYRRSWSRVLDYCLKNKVDVVHVQWYIFSPLDWYYHCRLRAKGIRVVATIHDLLPFNKKFYDPMMHKRIYAGADAIVNQARMNEEALVKEFGVQRDRITYVPHGHYMEYAEQATLEESREKLNIPVNRPVILFFGQIKTVKGVDVLLEALPKVIQHYPDALCVIAGKVWKDDFSVYQNLIDTLHLGENVRADIHFIRDDEIKYYFNAADIVALPYRQIYQSGVVLLAYAYEKPVVATTEGEFLTVVKPNETGLLVPSGNAEALADALIWYLDNPQQAKQYGVAGKADLMVRLSWDTIAQSMARIYEDVLK